VTEYPTVVACRPLSLYQFMSCEICMEKGKKMNVFTLHTCIKLKKKSWTFRLEKLRTLKTIFILVKFDIPELCMLYVTVCRTIHKFIILQTSIHLFLFPYSVFFFNFCYMLECLIYSGKMRVYMKYEMFGIQ
jgi:hypothetical protein